MDPQREQHPPQPNEIGGARQDILRAAKDLFAEGGYDAVSVAGIAARAGVSKGNVFHHFGSKEELYFAVIRSAVDRATEHFQRAVASEADPATRVDAAIRGSLSVLFEDEDRARLIFREVLESGPSRGELLANGVFGEEFTTLNALFADLQRRGAKQTRPSAPSPSFLAFLLVANNVMLFHTRHILRHLPGGAFADDPEHYTAMLREVLLQSVGIAPAQPAKPATGTGGAP